MLCLNSKYFTIPTPTNQPFQDKHGRFYQIVCHSILPPNDIISNLFSFCAQKRYKHFYRHAVVLFIKRIKILLLKQNAIELIEKLTALIVF